MDEKLGLLIELVERNPPLWNPAVKDHHNRDVVHRLWNEVALELNQPCKNVKSRWRGLRDNYRLELRKSESKWAHFQRLSFLRDVIRRRTLKAAFEPEPVFDETSNEKKIKTELVEESNNAPEEMSNLRTRKPYSRKHKTNSLPIQEEKFDVQIYETNEDYHFAMSIVPELKKIAPARKLLTKIKIQQLILENQINRNLKLRPSEASSPYSNSSNSSYEDFVMPVQTVWTE